MNDDRFAVLSDLIDGEMVDPEAVQQALNDLSGVDRLVAFTRLRWQLRRDDARLSNDTEIKLRALVSTPAAPSILARRLAVAAVLALALVGAGSLLGHFRGPSDRNHAPTPTRVVRFEPGVDWHPVPEVMP